VILFDSNVLVYALNRDMPQYRPCRDVVQRAMLGRLDAVVFPQVLMEFFATVTSRRLSPTPVSPADAMRRVDDWRTTLDVRYPTRRCLDEFTTLVEQSPRAGQQIHDIILAAQMRAHGIAAICTANTTDFAGIPGIEVRSPESV